MDNQYNVTSTATAQKPVIPLLAQLARAEELTQAMSMRLDPITNHVPKNASDLPNDMPRTVTARLQGLGDSLQYLLDNIEL